jgi:phytanoyl-CoA hydroxylase
MNTVSVTDIEAAAFRRDGYLVKKGMASAATCEALAAIAERHLEERIAPVEYEVDVHYPGAPLEQGAPGADTSRRLLQAYARDQAFRDWATSAEIDQTLKRLFADDDDVMLSQCHHNCVMTKSPGFSSVTLWHQDNRYWSFDAENLISVWLAMGDEIKANGCLRVIPGSHLVPLDRGRLDAALFLRPDIAENKALISQAEVVELEQGDVLFFHSKLFHAAGRNLTDSVKYSLVYTYHQASNKPIEGTRSARFPSISLG